MKRIISTFVVLAMLLGSIPANATTFSEDVSNIAEDTVVGAIMGGISGIIIKAIPATNLPHHEKPSTLLEMILDGIVVGGMLGFLNGLSKVE